MDFLLPLIGALVGCFIGIPLTCIVMYKTLMKPTKKHTEHRTMLNEDIREMGDDARYQNFKEQQKSWQ